MAYFTDQTNTGLAMEAWDSTGGAPSPAMPGVSVDSQRVATLSSLPSGTTATDYDYQFRPAPTVDAQRQVDMSQTLAAGESPTAYEYQVR
jgi:hypothetical protein